MPPNPHLAPPGQRDYARVLSRHANCREDADKRAGHKGAEGQKQPQGEQRQEEHAGNRVVHRPKNLSKGAAETKPQHTTITMIDRKTKGTAFGNVRNVPAAEEKFRIGPGNHAT